MITKNSFQKINDYLWEIPKSFTDNMLVPARVYASSSMLSDILNEKAIDQLINVATLPGIVGYALAMPDIHQGYGFPIGGVAAFDKEHGIISPGGVGYDINCGVRLLLSNSTHAEIKDKVDALITQIYRDVPSGVGSSGPLVLKSRDLDAVLNTGVQWALKHGYAEEADLDVIEEHGGYKYADANLVSNKAKERGADQLGTLGAGNHFLEIQEVVELYDEKAAQIFGLFQGQVTIMIHTGSRGLGHQVCTDYVRLMNKNSKKYQIDLVDRELACAPFQSFEGQEYFKAMAAAANFAWTNRQIITANIRKAWDRILGRELQGLSLLYDVAHNIAKLEQHVVGARSNKSQEVLVHRKGATRAFGPNHPEIPKKFQTTGQPVIIPGSMGTFSYVLAGTDDAMRNTFGSTCHGAGRRMSRSKAQRVFELSALRKQLADYGVVVRSGSSRGLLEEAPSAYKDIDAVIEVVSQANIAKKIAKLKPIAIVKG